MYRFVFIILLTSFSNFSCNRCGRFVLFPFECVGIDGNQFCYLKIIDKSTGRNLLFGTGAKYNFKEIKLVGENETLTFCDTSYTRFCGVMIRYLNGDSAIILSPTFGINVIRYKLWLSKTEADSIIFYTEHFTNDCCEEYPSLTSVKINNNSPSKLNDSLTIVLQK